MFAKNIKWLGRAGIVDVRGIRIAYVSGIDSDILGSEIMNADSKKNYLGNYFLASDIQDILLQNEESGKSLKFFIIKIRVPQPYR